MEFDLYLLEKIWKKSSWTSKSSKNEVENSTKVRQFGPYKQNTQIGPYANYTENVWVCELG